MLVNPPTFKTIIPTFLLRTRQWPVELLLLIEPNHSVIWTWFCSLNAYPAAQFLRVEFWVFNFMHIDKLLEGSYRYSVVKNQPYSSHVSHFSCFHSHTIVIIVSYTPFAKVNSQWFKLVMIHVWFSKIRPISYKGSSSCNVAVVCNCKTRINKGC